MHIVIRKKKNKIKIRNKSYSFDFWLNTTARGWNSQRNKRMYPQRSGGQQKRKNALVTRFDFTIFSNLIYSIRFIDMICSIRIVIYVPAFLHFEINVHEWPMFRSIHRLPPNYEKGSRKDVSLEILNVIVGENRSIWSPILRFVKICINKCTHQRTSTFPSLSFNERFWDHETKRILIIDRNSCPVKIWHIPTLLLKRLCKHLVFFFQRNETEFIRTKSKRRTKSIFLTSHRIILSWHFRSNTYNF